MAESVVDVWRVRGDAHAALRAILARRLGCEPERVGLERGRHGKPFVRGGPWFSLSHSGPEALVAVSGDRPVGVDIERVRPDRAVERLARRWLARDETAAIETLDSAQRAAAFHDCWVGKEAYVKGLGEGLGVTGTASFSVAALAGRAADRATVAHPGRGPARWDVQLLEAPAGHAAALAAPGADWRAVVKEYRADERDG